MSHGGGDGDGGQRLPPQEMQRTQEQDTAAFPAPAAPQTMMFSYLAPAGVVSVGWSTSLLCVFLCVLVWVWVWVCSYSHASVFALDTEHARVC